MSAGLVPLFTSAPRLRLHINEQPVAYAIGFNVNIAIDVQPVQIIGQFSGMALEPTTYNVVTGTMQIVRLVSNAALGEHAKLVRPEPLVGKASTTVNAVSDGGSEAIKTASGTFASSTQILNRGALYAHLDPTKVLASRSFDMDLYLTVPKIEQIEEVAASESGTSKVTNETKCWLRIKYCRLTSRNTNVAQGQLVNEPVNFQGLMATPTNVNGDDMFKLDSLTTEKLG